MRITKKHVGLLVSIAWHEDDGTPLLVGRISELRQGGRCFIWVQENGAVNRGMWTAFFRVAEVFGP